MATRDMIRHGGFDRPQSVAFLLLYNTAIRYPWTTEPLLYNMAIIRQVNRLHYLSPTTLGTVTIALSIPLNHRTTNWSVPGNAP